MSWLTCQVIQDTELVNWKAIVSDCDVLIIWQLLIKLDHDLSGFMSVKNQQHLGEDPKQNQIQLPRETPTDSWTMVGLPFVFFLTLVYLMVCKLSSGWPPEKHVIFSPVRSKTVASKTFFGQTQVSSSQTHLRWLKGLKGCNAQLRF